MSIKGNKGEWSEFYAFIKILTDGEMFAADKNLDILKDKFFTVLKIIREEKKNKKFYDISNNDGKVVVSEEISDRTKVVDLKNIKNKIADIFSEMKNSSDTTFEIALADGVMKDLECSQIRASSGRKSDIFVVIHDRISPTFQELGFSVKSMLGSPSTLLNASGSTNFVYEVTGLKNKLDDSLNAIEGSSKVRNRTKKIYNAGGNLEFCGVDSDAFRKNLVKIDSNFPAIMAEVLKIYFNDKGTKITDLVDYLAKDEALKEKFGLTKSDYEYKIKNFLSAVALGMMPNKEWDGFTKAHGGYIIVKENGDVVCYHLYNRDEFEEYLYRNTKLDTPSTTKHNFGKIYTEKGVQKFKYNLQIRFIK